LQKRAGGVAQGIGPEFKSQYHKKEKKSSLDGIDEVRVWVKYRKNFHSPGKQRSKID
jgi:hypothetical protein